MPQHPTRVEVKMGSFFDDFKDDDQTDQPSQDGIVPADLIDLPAPQVTILRLILARREMSYAQICDVTDKQPDRLSRAQLDETLNTLVEQRWLIREEPATYRINLRRKSAGPLNTETKREASR